MKFNATDKLSGMLSVMYTVQYIVEVDVMWCGIWPSQIEKIVKIPQSNTVNTP